MGTIMVDSSQAYDHHAENDKIHAAGAAAAKARRSDPDYPEPCPDCSREVPHEAHEWPFTAASGEQGYTLHCPGWSVRPESDPLPPIEAWPYLGNGWFDGVGVNAREKALFIAGHLQGRSMHGERAFLIQSTDEHSAALLVTLTRYGWTVSPYTYGNDPGGPGNTTTYRVFQP